MRTTSNGTGRTSSSSRRTSGSAIPFALASGTIQGLDRDARYLLRRMSRHPVVTGTPELERVAV